MKYPKLVRECDCKTEITVIVETQDIGENGEPLGHGRITTKCNYQGSGRRVIDEEQHYIELTGTALFPGDIFPELSEITTGTAIIFGETRQIHKGTKARNPDGTVNYVKLELI
jgi:hypothetical protein